MPELPPPLPSDARRRATATTDGFIFQWWLSVLAWLELGDAEALYLESSEDFEVTTATTAKTVQAKGGTSRAVTLRSEEVIAALNHFWALTTQETRTIRFVFLAQAEAGVEQGAPFGADAPGIRRWQEVATNQHPEAIEPLQRFLRDDPQVATKLAPSLQQFLRTASPAEFRARVVDSIVFDLGREPSGAVQQLVRDRLIVLAAERHGAAVAEAERIADTLFASVIQLAANKERVALTRAQLLRVLEEHTVKHRERLGLALPQVTAAAALVASSHAALWEAPTEDLKLPPLPGVMLCQRPALVAALRDHLAAAPVLILFGSAGMGKTTLAKQVAGSLAGSWWWLDLQGCPAAALQVEFRKVLAVADRNRRAPINLVLDGFAPDGWPAAALNTLRAVGFLLGSRGGRVVVTTQRPLTTTEIEGLGWTGATAITAPRMESDEIARFVSDLGCADPKLAELWATAVYVHTQGHPQLVHAACLWLQQKSWPKFDDQTFRDSATTVETERAQARRLVAKLSSEELELLTRLSVLGSTFRRDHVLALAEQLERLPGANFRFEALVGPWIEPGDANGYHRLSPLLDDTAATLPKARRADVDIACALVRLESKPVYVQDAARALQHAFAAKHAQLAADIAGKFLLTPQRKRAQAYSPLLWLTWISEAEVERLFSGQPIFATFIHLLRFQVVAELLPAQVGPFIAAAEKSMARMPQNVVAGVRFAFLGEVLMGSTKALTPAEALRYLSEAPALAMQLAPEMRIAAAFPRAMLPPSLRTVPDEDHVLISLAGLMLGHFQGREFVAGLVDALDKMPTERRNPLLRALGAWPTLFLLVWDKIWLAESEKAAPDWEPLLEWFGAMGVVAARWKSEEFAVAAARAASVVCNEYLNDCDRADRVLAGLEATMPAYVAALFDQRAKIASQRKQLPEALAAVREALPRWDDSDYGAHGKMLMLQRAGTWAGKLERWRESAGFFTEGVALAKKGRQLVAQAGLEADSAVSLWRAGEKHAAVDAFGRALELCPRMRPPLEDLATFQFQKMLGHILHALAMPERRPALASVVGPVVPGMASEIAVDEKVKSMPPPRLGACKVFLAMLEHNHQLGETYWQRYRDEVLQSRSVTTRQFGLELAIRKAIQRGACGELPAYAAQQASIFAVGYKMAAIPEADHLAAGDDAEFQPVSWAFDDQICGQRLFLAALINVAAQDGDLVAALRAFEANAALSPFPDALTAWAQSAHRIVGGSEAEMISLNRAAPVDADRVVASVTLLKQGRLAPDALWGVLYVTASSLASMYWGADVMRSLDALAGRRWRAAAENRFAFRNPTLWLPDLKARCGEPVTGEGRLAALLLAALPALDLKIDQGIVKQLQQMRDGTLDTGWQKVAPRLARA